MNNADRRTREVLLKRVGELEAKLARCRRARRGRETIQNRFRRLVESDRTAFYRLEISPVRRFSAEMAVRESEERLRRVTDNMLDMVRQTDERGILQYVSPSYKRILGYEPVEMLGRSILDFVHPEDLPEVAAALQSGADSSNPPRMEFRYRRSDGSYLWIESVENPLHDANGRVVGAVFASRDITERKRLEEQLLRSQRLAMAGQIASQVAHDFNNLLSPFVAYPELIKAQLPEGHPALPYCDDLREAALQMATINEDMLAMGRRGQTDLQPVELNPLVQQAMARMPDLPQGMKVDLHLDPSLLLVRGSPAQLLRVIVNLAVNAREAMPQGGVLTVKTENVYVDSPFGSNSCIEVGDYVRLTVEDTGCGVEPKARDRIFDAFFTTKTTGDRKGCGLGLSVVQAIVEDHRGLIDLSSSEGKGSAFSVYLPVCREYPKSSDHKPVTLGKLAQAVRNELDQTRT